MGEVYTDGRFTFDGNLINTGSPKINDSQKIKELLVELVRTTGNAAELGKGVLKRFFGAK